MKDNNDVQLSISIESSIENIWNVLTNEKAFNECFENLKMSCNEWKVGGKIIFTTQKNNEKIVDEALITSILENERLRYNYKKQNSNNEIEVLFDLKTLGNFTYLTIEVKDIKDELERSRSENTWINMMQEIKKYVQKK